MDIEKIREYCLSLPHATEDVKWKNDLTFCVGEKMFTVVGLEPGICVMSFKCTPEDFEKLIERPGVIPAPYLTIYKWVALESFEALSEKELKGYIKNSYKLVFEKLPKTLQKQLLDQ